MTGRRRRWSRSTKRGSRCGHATGPRIPPAPEPRRTGRGRWPRADQGSRDGGRTIRLLDAVVRTVESPRPAPAAALPRASRRCGRDRRHSMRACLGIGRRLRRRPPATFTRTSARARSAASQPIPQLGRPGHRSPPARRHSRRPAPCDLASPGQPGSPVGLFRSDAMRSVGRSRSGQTTRQLALTPTAPGPVRPARTRPSLPFEGGKPGCASRFGSGRVRDEDAVRTGHSPRPALPRS